MSRQGKAAQAAPKVEPAADGPDLTEAEPVEGALALPLHTEVAEAARAAIAEGRYVDHSALHSLESALGAVRNRLAEAERILSPDYADLVERIRLVI